MWWQEGRFCFCSCSHIIRPLSSTFSFQQKKRVIKKGGARKAVKKAGIKKGAKQPAGGKKKGKPVKKPSSPARQLGIGGGIGGGVIVPPTVDEDTSNRAMPGVTVPQTVQTTYQGPPVAGADEYEAPGDLDQEDGEPEGGRFY
jgi:hypothetical protein